MIHTIIKKSICNDFVKCSNDIIEKIQEEYSEFNPFGLDQNCHVHIIHEKNNHKIEIVVLDKYLDNIPTLKKLKKLLN
mgnify:CR=1 FL=1